MRTCYAAPLKDLLPWLAALVVLAGSARAGYGETPKKGEQSPLPGKASWDLRAFNPRSQRASARRHHLRACASGAVPNLP